MESTFTLDELKHDPGMVIATAKTSKTPITVKQNGNPMVVMVDADTYMSQMQSLSEAKAS